MADPVAPWTIKNIPPDVRAAAIKAAEREKQSIGEWIARAIRSQIQSDRQQDRAPAIVLPEADRPVRPQVDLSEVERAVSLICDLSASGAPPPKRVASLAYGLIRGSLIEMRGPTGTAKSKTNDADGLTEGPAGQTEPDESQTELADANAHEAVEASTLVARLMQRLQDDVLDRSVLIERLRPELAVQLRPGAGQRGKLHRWMLVVSADAGIVFSRIECRRSSTLAHVRRASVTDKLADEFALVRVRSRP